VDDIMSTGNTFTNIVRAIMKEKRHAKCEAAYLYAGYLETNFSLNWGADVPDIHIYSNWSMSRSGAGIDHRSYSGGITSPY
jgi:hypothetical protein